MEQGILTANPALRLKRPEDERKSLPAPHLTVEEVGQLLAVSATDPLAAYWRVQVEAGLRPAEGLALCWLDVDLGAGIVTVRHALVRNNAGWELAPPKTHQQRAVAISPPAVELLRQHRARQAEQKLRHGQRYNDQGLVFCDEIGRVLDPAAVSKRFKALALAAGVRPDARLYSLRHSSATHALQDGLDYKSVSKKLGHSTPVVTLATYAHAAPLDVERRHTERIAARYDAPSGPAKHA